MTVTLDNNWDNKHAVSCCYFIKICCYRSLVSSCCFKDTNFSPTFKVAQTYV